MATVVHIDFEFAVTVVDRHHASDAIAADKTLASVVDIEFPSAGWLIHFLADCKSQLATFVWEVWDVHVYYNKRLPGTK